MVTLVGKCMLCVGFCCNLLSTLLMYFDLTIVMMSKVYYISDHLNNTHTKRDHQGHFIETFDVLLRGKVRDAIVC